MNIITILVLLSLNGQTTQMTVIEEFKSQQQCQEADKEFITERHLDEKLARRLKCLTIITDPIKDA